MASYKNIFCASNPAKLLDALWEFIKDDISQIDKYTIFLPSRRAVRTVEKLLVIKTGNALLLPTLVALGEGADEDQDTEINNSSDVISNSERVIILAKLLTADPNIRTISSALPIAGDLVRMQDYLENEGVDSSNLNWLSMIDEKYAQHFQQKAKFLDIVTKILPMHTAGYITQSKKRNNDIRGWKNALNNQRKVIVCGSTASVPATADLMTYIAEMKNGYIILPGKISGRVSDFEQATNPYNSEYNFLKRIDIDPSSVSIIDVGVSDIDFFNSAFGNSGNKFLTSSNAQLIECSRESEEADTVAEIAARCMANNKTVLVITPDAAGSQRIAESLYSRGLIADFSGGRSGTMTPVGRAILNLFDDWMEDKNPYFNIEYSRNEFNLFNTIVGIIEMLSDTMMPKFQLDTDESIAVWDAIKNTSDILNRNGIKVNLADTRSLIADALKSVSIRPPMNDNAQITVLGTIESRMQTADVVILTALNEGMFPSTGYENSWLPRPLADAIGLPSPDRKISLMAMDFINLSCAHEVYWMRSKTAGSNQTTQSRFISRVDVVYPGIRTDSALDILSAVRNRDAPEHNPLNYVPPRPPADFSDVYVTELDLLIHNPYAFYVRHILRLRPRDNYWQEPDARDFGNLIHKVIELANGWSVDKIIFEMDARATKILPAGSVIFHFWHKRFVEIAPIIKQVLSDVSDASVEIQGQVNIVGRIVRAKADRVWDGVVMDVKTCAAPSKDKLLKGMCPQLPLEAYMIQNNGFSIKTTIKSQTPVMQFLQLQNNNIELIEYNKETTQLMIDAAIDKISQLFGRYSNDFEPYEYYETGDKKYKIYDDFARIDD